MATNYDETLCYVEVTDEMREKEQELSNAIIARPLQLPQGRLLIADILQTLEQQYPPSMLPTKITRFAPDYILHYPTRAIQQIILSHGAIEGPNFIFDLIPWTNEYRCNKIPYNTHVIIEIEGVPPQAAFKEILDTVLLPHCNIQTCDYDEKSGICTVNAFAQSAAAIPARRTLGLSYDHGNNVNAFPLKLHAQEYEDPQAIAEADEDMEFFIQELEGKWNIHAGSSSSSYGYLSDSSFDPNDYETIDSDREPKLWKDY